jgi:hypothetical protein
MAPDGIGHGRADIAAQRPAVAAAIRPKWPWEARYPAKGMMISEGSGMQADSIAIIRATPKRPVAAMVAMMKPARR